MNDTMNTNYNDLLDDDLNIIVMNDAGKLIFNRNTNDINEEDLCSMCGLIQAIRATTLHDPTLDFGDIQCINANKSKTVFMTVGSITLVAITKKAQKTQKTIDHYTEAFLRLQLEIVYSGIIFTLTDSVQYMLGENPTLDVREMLGSSGNVLRGALDDVNFYGDQSFMFLGGIDVFGPVPSEIRDYSSKVLTTACSRNESVIYAILSINKKLFNIIQPHNKHHQLQSFDISLLLQFVNSQTQLTISNELWFPICLPTLSEVGFVNGYQCIIGMDGLLKLTIISQDPSIEEFDRIHAIAHEIRSELGLLQPKEQILRIYQLDEHNEEEGIRDEHLIWERTNANDYNDDISDDEENSVDDVKSYEKKKYGFHLLRSIKKTLNQDYQKHIMQSYCEIASVTHFAFCYSVPIRNCHSGSTAGGGSLSQCYSPSMNFIEEKVSKKCIWNAYQKLSLRLRLGSASPQSTLRALDGIQFSAENEEDSGISKFNQYRPSQTLHGKGILRDGVTYYVQGDELFLGLSGKNYELYVTMPATVSPTDANTLSAVLVDTLISDIRDLLQCKPQSF